MNNLNAIIFFDAKHTGIYKHTKVIPEQSRNNYIKHVTVNSGDNMMNNYRFFLKYKFPCWIKFISSTVISALLE